MSSDRIAQKVQEYAAAHNLSEQETREMEQKCQAALESLKGLTLPELREKVGLTEVIENDFEKDLST